jgi:hypothetical protein
MTDSTILGSSVHLLAQALTANAVRSELGPEYTRVSLDAGVHRVTFSGTPTELAGLAYIMLAAVEALTVEVAS